MKTYRITKNQKRPAFGKDPTRTVMLRRAFMLSLRKGYNQFLRAIRDLVVKQDSFDLRRGAKEVPKLLANQFQFLSDPEKIKAFEEWLATQAQGDLASVNTVEEYLIQGAQRGAGNAYEMTRTPEVLSAITEEEKVFYGGEKNQFISTAFNQPVARERFNLLVSRTFTDLQKINQALLPQLSVVLADGFVQGQNPRTVARNISRAIGITRAKAESIARTEIIRAHAEGQLIAFEQLGVEEVGVAAEWSTAGDDRVCPLCQPLESVILKVKEARGLIPRHPNCRCSWIPANIGEPRERKYRTKAQIKRRFKKSRKAEGKGRPPEDRWAGADREIDKSRPEPIVKPTKNVELFDYFVELLTNFELGVQA